MRISDWSSDVCSSDLQIASTDEADVRCNPFERSLVSGVVLTRGGAHPTSHVPGYGWDAAHLMRYCAAAEEEGGWTKYVEEFLKGDEADRKSTRLNSSH